MDGAIGTGLKPPPSFEPSRSRQLSRSPHPYHRRGANLPLEPSKDQYERVERDLPVYTGDNTSTNNDSDDTEVDKSSRKALAPSPKSSSDSGTEADDEGGGFLKVLPAPAVRPRKGLRMNGIDESVSPLLTPTVLDVDLRKLLVQDSKKYIGSKQDLDIESKKVRNRKTRRKLAEVVRRVFEAGILVFVGFTVYRGEGVASCLRNWRKEFFCHGAVTISLYGLHPLRLLQWRNNSSTSGAGHKPLLRIPVTFDPAPLLYPLLIPIFVAISLTPSSPGFTLPNLMLSLASLPPRLMPFQGVSSDLNVTHWFLATSPLLVSQNSMTTLHPSKPFALKMSTFPNLQPEILSLLFPLHQALLPTLEFLTTTSLLPAELQLLDIGLINLLLFARSPQAEILNAVLWIGGLSLFVLCRHVLTWEVALARVPSWRFRRSSQTLRSSTTILAAVRRLLTRKSKRRNSSGDVETTSGSSSDDKPPTSSLKIAYDRFKLNARLEKAGIEDVYAEPASAIEERAPLVNFETNGFLEMAPHNTVRRHTFSTLDGSFSTPRRARTTPSGRPKRSVSGKAKPFLNLTTSQAQVRKWLYASYTYAAAFLIILLPIRKYIMGKALQGYEPFGWALGYLLGDVPSFRFWVVKSNLEWWIPFPARFDGDDSSWILGSVEHSRRDTIGEANTRLMISVYCTGVIAVGLAIVFRLSAIVEVDTRRKVFHGMMVAMFLPTIFVDPAFVGLALGLVLAIFLILDLFRASQLPPISRPLTYFLAPYVDGRDHRGPVIVSHIFLLIGCAIPLWLSLAALQRSGQRPWAGWDVDTRDISMVSGVICVGMGDAAASLVGRRYGRRKWFFSGGKSLEGSVAFAAAVVLGLMASRIWLDVGRWPRSPETQDWSYGMAFGKATVAATTASLTEAALTGGNDNVIVPLVLWLMVRGLGI